MIGPRSRRWDVLAVLLLGFVAFAGSDPGGVAFDLRQASNAPARITGEAAVPAETVLPSQPRLDNGSWVERGPQKLRPHPGLVVLLGTAALLALLLYDGLCRPLPGRPSLRRRGHGAVLRGPPLLLTP